MHVLVRDNLCDRDYIARHTLGFDRVEREVLPRFTPNYVASGHRHDRGGCGTARCDVWRGQAIIDPSRRWGMTRFTYGGQALRTVALLPGVTGAYGALAVAAR